jgi:hypothetical protein
LGQKGCQRLPSSFLQIDIAEIVLDKADQPNSFFDFFDSRGMTAKTVLGLIFLPCRQMRLTVGDVDGAVVKRISQFGQAAIVTGGRRVEFRGHFMPKAYAAARG